MKQSLRSFVKHGVSLVEFLTVLAVLGVVSSILLPAIQVARETARNTSCQSHLRQLSLGFTSHELSFRMFPSNGWGLAWVGDADKGQGINQPGGWTFAILPYMEQNQLWQHTSGKHGREKLMAMSTLLELPVSMFNCPSRRSTALQRYKSDVPLVNALRPSMAFKVDYAANGGTNSYNREDISTDLDFQQDPRLNISLADGAVFIRYPFRLSEFTDGLSNVVLLGEKNVYKGGNPWVEVNDIGDDQGAFVGDDVEHRRFGHLPPIKDGGQLNYDRFGSNHSRGINVVMCDTACRTVSFSVDPIAFRMMTNRRDGSIQELDQFRN
jgi:prepilin-type N-terminal cleavage/methylation domain-containing protein